MVESIDRYDEAMASAERAIRENAGMTRAYLTRARLRARIGDRTGAAEDVLMSERVSRRLQEEPTGQVSRLAEWRASLEMAIESDGSKESWRDAADPVAALESLIKAESPLVSADRNSLDLRLALALEHADVDHERAALRVLEDAAALAARVHAEPPVGLWAKGVRETVESAFVECLIRLESSSEFADLRSADGFTAVLDAWRRTRARWR